MRWLAILVAMLLALAAHAIDTEQAFADEAQQARYERLSRRHGAFAATTSGAASESSVPRSTPPYSGRPLD